VRRMLPPIHQEHSTEKVWRRCILLQQPFAERFSTLLMQWRLWRLDMLYVQRKNS
jgi:hypothetical protein